MDGLDDGSELRIVQANPLLKDPLLGIEPVGCGSEAGDMIAAMQDDQAWLHPLPPLLRWPLVALSIFATAWPSFREISLSAIPWRRRYEQQKMKLELLKLSYEIEALKKDHHLEALPYESEIATALKPEYGAVAAFRPLSRLSTLASGGLGGALVNVLRITYAALHENVSWAVNVRPFLGSTLAVFLGAGILVLLFMPRKRAVVWTTLGAGAILGFALDGFLAAAEDSR